MLACRAIGWPTSVADQCLVLSHGPWPGDNPLEAVVTLKTLLGTSVLAVGALGFSGCSTGAGNGAIIGGATGAGAGLVLTHGHPGGALLGGALGAITGAAIGSETDRDRYYRSRYYDDDGPYYRDRYYYYSAPPGSMTETTTTYRNPDGSTSTYVSRSYNY